MNEWGPKSKNRFHRLVGVTVLHQRVSVWPWMEEWKSAKMLPRSFFDFHSGGKVFLKGVLHLFFFMSVFPGQIQPALLFYLLSTLKQQGHFWPEPKDGNSQIPNSAVNHFTAAAVKGQTLWRGSL